VSTPAQREARAALDAARPAVARLDTTRGPEDLAADLIEMWRAVEASLRSLVGSSALSGQALIREARQRQLLSFDHANSLAEFQAVYDRVQDTSYRPTDADVNAARTAFLKLDSALAGDQASEFARPAPGTPASGPVSAPLSGSVAPAVAPAVAPPLADPRLEHLPPPPRRVPAWALAAAGALAVVILVVVLIFARRGSAGGGSMAQGIDAYRRGQREVAVNDFNKAVREDPHAALPHVYLARMAREVGNTTLASQELQLALEAEPTNAIALREMGANLLTQGNYELARRFYVRAVQADPTDKTAQGYLGCTLMRLNRATEAASFLNRAGEGPWSNCTPANAASSLKP
jgi:tetratricopeptide (TPR) repeat protein